jgi:hypothetical protein
MLTRRLLLGSALATVATALGRRSLSAGPATGRRLIVVFNPGGWDPLSCVAPMYDAPGVVMAPGSGPATAGGPLRGPAPDSRILQAIADHDDALELEEDLRALPGQIASQPDFLCTIQNNQAVRRCVGALRDKWYGAR